MPSLPTSLIIVVLVAAWLVVLVPMVSKRREEVPEAEDGTANFRVLERRARRSQPVLARTARIGDEDLEESGAGGSADADAGSDGELGLADTAAKVDTPHDDNLERPDDDVAGDGAGPGGRDVGRDASAATPSSVRATPSSVRAAEARAVSATYEAAEAHGRGRADWREPVVEDDSDPMGPDRRASSRPAPHRTGRGGYDPRAAERARQERFHRRRRTALVLFVLAALGTAVGVFGADYGYIGAGMFGSLLVLYFAYLRRQVRIEEEIRHRRAVRLERARQIRPQYRPSVAEQVWMHRTGETERPRPGAVPEFHASSHVRQTVPAAQYGHAVALDLDDSDPAFDELAYYRPSARQRRAS